MVRYLKVLKSGAGPNFILESIVPAQLRPLMRSGTVPNVVDANNNPLKTVGTINLVIRLGRSVVNLCFLLCCSMAASVILGCDYCERLVKAMLTSLKEAAPRGRVFCPHRCPTVETAVEKSRLAA